MAFSQAGKAYCCHGPDVRKRTEALLRILILGGDGFCGWPTSLHLSARGHEVDIVDNFARRRADAELGAESLTPISPLDVRRAAWRERTGNEIGFHEIDVAREPGIGVLRDAFEAAAAPELYSVALVVWLAGSVLILVCVCT